MKFENQKLLLFTKAKAILFAITLFFLPLFVTAQTDEGVSFFPNKSIDFIGLMVFLIIGIVSLVFLLVIKLDFLVHNYFQERNTPSAVKYKKYLNNLSASEIEA